MKYLLLIYSDESKSANIPPEMAAAFMEEFKQYTIDMIEAGIRLGGEALQPTSTATTIHVEDGKMITTHGPYAETKEQLGGFYLIDVENLDQAIEWAAKIPTARTGRIEVRPIVTYDLTA